jgi:urease gamma subunit
VALIGAVIAEGARDGRTVTGQGVTASPCSRVTSSEARHQETFPEIPVTATFPDGTRPVTVHPLTV